MITPEICGVKFWLKKGTLGYCQTLFFLIKLSKMIKKTRFFPGGKQAGI